MTVMYYYNASRPARARPVYYVTHDVYSALRYSPYDGQLLIDTLCLAPPSLGEKIDASTKRLHSLPARV